MRKKGAGRAFRRGRTTLHTRTTSRVEPLRVIVPERSLAKGEAEKWWGENLVQPMTTKFIWREGTGSSGSKRSPRSRPYARRLNVTRPRTEKHATAEKARHFLFGACIVRAKRRDTPRSARGDPKEGASHGHKTTRSGFDRLVLLVRTRGPKDKKKRGPRLTGSKNLSPKKKRVKRGIGCCKSGDCIQSGCRYPREGPAMIPPSS